MQFFQKNNYWLLFIIALLLCVLGSGSSLIYILDEAKNSEAAREMLINSNWFKPTFNNVIRTDKPPLHYFFMMLGYKLFGINAFGARFFSGVFGALTIMNTYSFTKRHLGNLIANVCYFILISSFYFIQEFHLAVPDPYLIFFISAALFYVADFLSNHDERKLWLAYICIGFGVLTKGPVAIAMPCMIVFIFLILSKQLAIKPIAAFKIHIGLPIVFLIAFPWFYFAHIETNGVFTDGFFFKHNVGRFQSKMEGHGGIFLITWAFVLLGMLPFSFWFFRALFYGFKARAEQPIIHYLSVAILVFIAFFSIAATKLPNYTMPCYPLIAVLLAWFFIEKIWNSTGVKWDFIELFFITLIALAVPIVVYILLGQDPQLKEIQWLSYGLLFLPLGIVSALFLYIKKQFGKSLFLVGISFTFLGIYLFLIAFPALTKFTPVAKAREVVEKNAPVIVYKRFDAAFPINEEKNYKVVQTIDEVKTFFNKQYNGVVMTNTRDKKSIDSLNQFTNILTQKSLFESHTTRLYRKK